MVLGRNWCCAVCLYVENAPQTTQCAVCDSPNYKKDKVKVFFSYLSIYAGKKQICYIS